MQFETCQLTCAVCVAAKNLPVMFVALSILIATSSPAKDLRRGDDARWVDAPHCPIGRSPHAAMALHRRMARARRTARSVVRARLSLRQRHRRARQARAAQLTSRAGRFTASFDVRQSRRTSCSRGWTMAMARRVRQCSRASVMAAAACDRSFIGLTGRELPASLSTLPRDLAPLWS